jgi:CRP/FNR family transcriptional regulator, cyclic AMP receptor protein
MMNLNDLLEDPDFLKLVPFSKETYPASTVILNAADESQDVYFILSGEVRVTASLGAHSDNLEKLEPALAKLSAGDFFGELAMFDGEPRSAGVSAITDCEIAKVDGAAMIAFMDKYPEKGYFVMRELFMNLVLRMRQNNSRTATVLELYLQEK